MRKDYLTLHCPVCDDGLENTTTIELQHTYEYTDKIYHVYECMHCHYRFNAIYMLTDYEIITKPEFNSDMDHKGD